MNLSGSGQIGALDPGRVEVSPARLHRDLLPPAGPRCLRVLRDGDPDAAGAKEARLVEAQRHPGRRITLGAPGPTVGLRVPGLEVRILEKIAGTLQERPVIGQGNVGRECRWGVCLPSIFGGASRPVLGNSAAGLHAARSRREVEVIGLDGAGLDGGPVEEKHIPKPGVVDNAGAIHHLQSVEVGLAQKAPGQPGQFDAIHARVDRLVRKVHDPQRDAPAPRLAPASGVNGPLGVRSDLREAQRFGRRSDC